MIPDTNTNEIIICQPDNTVKLEVHLENEAVWFTQFTTTVANTHRTHNHRKGSVIT
ncbi:hypothetical protein AGMMS50267_16700 [Spirochaetia bacterium]|nr:hypothetical protein AGMMS50267_16700 [Spirochaetia bacterium]